MLSASNLVGYKIVDQDDIEDGRRTGIFQEHPRPWGLCRICFLVLFIMLLVGFCMLTLIPITSSSGRHVNFKHINTTVDKKNNTNYNVITGHNNIILGKNRTSPLFPFKTHHLSLLGKLTHNFSQSTINPISTDIKSIKKSNLKIPPLHVIVNPTNKTSKVKTNVSKSKSTHDTKTTNITLASNTTPTSTVMKPTNKLTLSTIHPKQIISESNHSTKHIDKSNSSKTNLPASTKLIENTTEGRLSVKALFPAHHPQFNSYTYHQTKKIGEDINEIVTRHVIWVMCGTILCLFSVLSCFLLCCIGRRRKIYYGFSRAGGMSGLMEADKVELLNSHTLN